MNNAHDMTEDATAVCPQSSSTIIFLMVCGWVVFLMQVGFAMLTAGSIGVPSVTNMLFLNTMDAVVGIFVWFATGYAIAYGDNSADESSVLSYRHFFGYELNPCDFAFWFYQWTFAATVTVIVSGAVGGRITLAGYLAYTVAITGFIYPIVVHWAWAKGGWLADQDDGHKGELGGYADFAGSGVVHACGGACALVGAYFCGPRSPSREEKQYPQQESRMAHSQVLVQLGTIILFFGFFGFNAGSVLSLETQKDAIRATRACLTTALAASGGGITASCWHYRRNKQWSLVEACNGALAGMVAICASADVAEMWAAWLIGCIGSVAFKLLGALVHRWGIDDVCDAVGLHLGAGCAGVLLRPILANQHSVLHWDKIASTTLLWNFIGCVVIVAWSLGCSALTFGIIHKLGWCRYSDQILDKGIDLEIHGEPAYVGMNRSSSRRPFSVTESAVPRVSDVSLSAVYE